MQLTPIIVMLGAAAVMVLGIRPVLARLPEPDEGDGKPLYRDLGTTRFVAITSALTALGVAISWLSLGRDVQPLWWVLAVFGVLLAAIDARTTWLPLLLTRFAWLAMALATLIAAALATDAMAARQVPRGRRRRRWPLPHRLVRRARENSDSGTSDSRR